MSSDLSEKLWADLQTVDEQIEFLESGRARETGIIAAAIVQDVANAFRCMKERDELQQELDATRKQRDELIDREWKFIEKLVGRFDAGGMLVAKQHITAMIENIHAELKETQNE